MFLLPAPRASAQIEVVEFSDASRLIRFKKEDLQDMVDHYLSLESYAEMRRQRVETQHQMAETERRTEWRCGETPDCCLPDTRLSPVCGNLVLLLFLFGFCGSCMGPLLLVIYSIDPNPDDIGLIYGGIPTFLMGLLMSIASCYCGKMCCCYEYRAYSPPQLPVSEIDRWKERHAREIKDILIKEKVNIESILGRKLPHGVLAADESQPLLQSNQDIPEYFLLFERPEDKVNFDPKPFFTTDRDTSYSQSLISNGFAGLIRNVAGQLRARGARIKTRYHVTRVGSELPKVHIDDPRVMPEVDSVEVVVDRADA